VRADIVGLQRLDECSQQLVNQRHLQQDKDFIIAFGEVGRFVTNPFA
jgi:hypothetical protein